MVISAELLSSLSLYLAFAALSAVELLSHKAVFLPVARSVGLVLIPSVFFSEPWFVIIVCHNSLLREAHVLTKGDVGCNYQYTHQYCYTSLTLPPSQWSPDKPSAFPLPQASSTD